MTEPFPSSYDGYDPLSHSSFLASFPSPSPSLIQYTWPLTIYLPRASNMAGTAQHTFKLQHIFKLQDHSRTHCHSEMHLNCFLIIFLFGQLAWCGCQSLRRRHESVRLVLGGFDRIFEIGRCFRNEGSLSTYDFKYLK